MSYSQQKCHNTVPLNTHLIWHFFNSLNGNLIVLTMCLNPFECFWQINARTKYLKNEHWEKFSFQMLKISFTLLYCNTNCWFKNICYATYSMHNFWDNFKIIFTYIVFYSLLLNFVTDFVIVILNTRTCSGL